MDKRNTTHQINHNIKIHNHTNTPATKDQSNLVQSLKKLIRFASQGSQCQRQIFVSFNRNDLQKIMSNFQDQTNQLLRKLSTRLITLLLWKSAQNKTQFCRFFQIVPRKGRIVLNRLPKCFLNLGLKQEEKNEQQTQRGRVINDQDIQKKKGISLGQIMTFLKQVDLGINNNKNNVSGINKPLCYYFGKGNGVKKNRKNELSQSLLLASQQSQRQNSILINQKNEVQQWQLKIVPIYQNDFPNDDFIDPLHNLILINIQDSKINQINHNKSNNVPNNPMKQLFFPDKQTPTNSLQNNQSPNKRVYKQAIRNNGNINLNTSYNGTITSINRGFLKGSIQNTEKTRQQLGEQIKKGNEFSDGLYKQGRNSNYNRGKVIQYNNYYTNGNYNEIRSVNNSMDSNYVQYNNTVGKKYSNFDMSDKL